MTTCPSGKPWRVEALEEYVGSGWHITFHPTHEAAVHKARLCFEEPNIVEVRIFEHTTEVKKCLRQTLTVGVAF